MADESTQKDRFEPVDLWDRDSDADLARLGGDTLSKVTVAIAQSGRRIDSRADVGTARMWDGDSGRRLEVSVAHRVPVADTNLL